MTSKHIDGEHRRNSHRSKRPGLALTDKNFIKIQKKPGFNLLKHSDHLKYKAIKILITEISKSHIRVKCDCPIGIVQELKDELVQKVDGNQSVKKNVDITRDHHKLDITRYVGQAIHIYTNKKYSMHEIIEDLSQNGIIVQVIRNKINSARVTLNASDKWDVKRCEIDNRDIFEDDGEFYLNFIKVSENELEADVFDNLMRLASKDDIDDD